jgi:hypothetical protein
VKSAFLGILIAAAPAAQAAPLTVHAGESWMFAVRKGEPVNAHKVDASAKPARGQIMVTVRSAFGTNMVMTNNSPVPYTFRAELLVDGKSVGARPCDLPANAKPILEQWPQKAEAVRISRFKQAGPGGRC